MLDIMEMRGFEIVRHKTSGSLHLRTPGDEFYYLLPHPKGLTVIATAFEIFKNLSPVYK